MRVRTVFWASILILAGILLLLNNFGIIDVDLWGVLGPLFLIALGLWVLWGVFFGHPSLETEEVVIPLQDAARAHVHIRHGAGRLRLDASAASGELITGSFGGGLDYTANLEVDTLQVRMRTPHFPSHYVMPWNWGVGSSLDWNVGLSDEVPLFLELEGGAGQSHLDLTDLCVTDLRLQTGASSTEIILPADAGHTRAKINAGAASVVVHVPPNVSARIRAGGGLASINVDRQRFPREGGVYLSPDYDIASNKVDLDIEAGVGSISVR